MRSMPTAPTRSSKPRARRTARTSGRVRTAEAQPSVGCAGLAGAAELPALQRRGITAPLSAVLLVVAAVVVTAVGCGEGEAVRQLMDGSRVVAPAVELEGIAGPAVQTKLRARRAGAFDPARLGACSADSERLPEGRVVIERVGVRGEGISFRDASGRLLCGCDNSPGPREGNHPWCGEAVGDLQNRHLTDSRLGVGCKAGDREPMGFAWIEPGAGARYVAVEQPGYTEVYEVALGLPVRVS